MGEEEQWEEEHCLAIPLVCIDSENNLFYRPPAIAPTQYPLSMTRDIDPKLIYISRLIPAFIHYETGIRLSSDFLREATVIAAHPPNWDLSNGWLWKLNDAAIRMTDQIILLVCIDDQDLQFVVRVDYTFEEVDNMLDWQEDFVLKLVETPDIES